MKRIRLFEAPGCNQQIPVQLTPITQPPLVVDRPDNALSEAGLRGMLKIYFEDHGKNGEWIPEI